MKAELKKNAFFKFAIISIISYLVFYLIYNYIVKKYTYYDQNFIGHIIKVSNSVLQTIGYKTFLVLQDRDYQVIGVDGSSGVWIGSKCNSITLFALFSVFIIAYPGVIKHKLWFIPLGVLIIHTLNICRVVALALIAFYSPESLNFNHTYTFTFLIYIVIFTLWVIWINKFSKPKLN